MITIYDISMSAGRLLKAMSFAIIFSLIHAPCIAQSFPDNKLWEKVDITVGERNDTSFALIARYGGKDKRLLSLADGTMMLYDDSNVFVSKDAGSSWIEVDKRTAGTSMFSSNYFTSSGDRFWSLLSSNIEDGEYAYASADGTSWQKFYKEDLLNSSIYAPLNVGIFSGTTIPGYHRLSIHPIEFGTLQNLIESDGLGDQVIYSPDGKIRKFNKEELYYENDDNIYVNDGTKSSVFAPISKVFQWCDNKYLGVTKDRNFISDDNLNYELISGHPFSENRESIWPRQGFRIINVYCQYVVVYGQLSNETESGYYITDNLLDWKILSKGREGLDYNFSNNRFYKYVPETKTTQAGLYITKDSFPCECGKLSSVDTTSFTFNVTVDVPLIGQENDHTCWAASIAMMKSWKQNEPLTIHEVLFDRFNIKTFSYWLEYVFSTDGIDIHYPHLKDGKIEESLTVGGTGGLDRTEWEDFYEKTMGLTGYKMSYSLRGILQLLQEKGPLLVSIDPVLDGETPGGHSIVVTGMYGDGSAEKTFVRYNDPWRGGTVKEESFAIFTLKMMEALSSNSGENYTYLYYFD